MAKGKLILIVDDDVFSLRVVSDMLEKGGFTVLSASDPLEAIRLVEQKSPAVVVTDAIMPNMHGLEMARRVLELGRGTQVVMMTGSAEPINVIDAYRTGVSDFVVKGFAPEVLLEIVSEACARQERWKSLVHEAFKMRYPAG